MNIVSRVALNLPSLRRGRQSGFTLIELLIVIAIIVVLIALLLPAIQQSREAARRTLCKNNLMQIGLALNNYMMAHQVLPPGTQNGTGPIQSKEGGGYHMGWMTQILPYLEERNAYDRIDFTKSVYDPINASVRSHLVRCFLCPSSLAPSGAGLTNYSGVHNDIERPIDVDQNGVLFLNSSIDDEQIRDGRSNTIFVMETSANWGKCSGLDVRNSIVVVQCGGRKIHRYGFHERFGTNLQIARQHDQQRKHR